MPASPGSGFLTVSIQFAGQRELIGKFATWGQNISDLSSAWEKVGELLQDDWRQQFASEGGYLGVRVGPEWAPLAPATVADRLRRGYDGEHPILVRTGQLRASVIERGAAGNIFEVGSDHVTVGTEYPTAQFHQFGTVKMPARRMLGLKWETRSEILRILGDEVRAQARAAGLAMSGGA